MIVCAKAILYLWLSQISSQPYDYSKQAWLNCIPKGDCTRLVLWCQMTHRLIPIMAFCNLRMEPFFEPKPGVLLIGSKIYSWIGFQKKPFFLQENGIKMASAKWVHFVSVWICLSKYHSYDTVWLRPTLLLNKLLHDDVIKWKHFPRYWPFVRGIHRSPVNSPHKGQWRGALMFTLSCVWING